MAQTRRVTVRRKLLNGMNPKDDGYELTAVGTNFEYNQNEQKTEEDTIAA